MFAGPLSLPPLVLPVGDLVPVRLGLLVGPDLFPVLPDEDNGLLHNVVGVGFGTAVQPHQVAEDPETVGGEEFCHLGIPAPCS